MTKFLILITFACLSCVPRTFQKLSDTETLDIGDKISTYVLAPPKSDSITKSINVWATEYHVHMAKQDNTGVAIQSQSQEIFARISRKDWCFAALEGTVRIELTSSQFRTFNFAGVGERSQVNCREFFPNLAPLRLERMSRVFFRPSRGEFGEGFENKLALLPYRSIAVDLRNQTIQNLKFGDVVFIPAARGIVFEFRGKSFRHDGYFFVADTGGAIENNHIDIFIGDAVKNPFPFIKGESQVFELQILKRPDLNRAFLKAHEFRE